VARFLVDGSPVLYNLCPVEPTSRNRTSISSLYSVFPGVTYLYERLPVTVDQTRKRCRGYEGEKGVTEETRLHKGWKRKGKMHGIYREYSTFLPYRPNQRFY
jgi:hypothetical protein